MGRKTYESLPKFPLPGRHNIVVSSSMKSSLSCPNVACDLDEAYLLAKRLIGRKKAKFGSLVVHHYMNKYQDVI